MTGFRNLLTGIPIPPPTLLSAATGPSAGTLEELLPMRKGIKRFRHDVDIETTDALHNCLTVSQLNLALERPFWFSKLG